MLDVGDHGELDRADAALLHRRAAPGVMGELRVDGDTDHLDAQLAELIHAVVVGDDFRGADESEVERPEEQYDVLAAQAGKLEGIDDGTVAEDRGGSEIGGLLVDQYAHREAPRRLGCARRRQAPGRICSAGYPATTMH